MTPILKVGLITLVALVVGTVMLYWPSSADPKSPDVHERLKAISGMVGSSDRGSLDTLGELVSDAELRVAKAAIRALGSRKDEAARLELGQILAKNKIGELRGAAATALGNFKNTDYSLLIDVLLKDKAPKARAGAAKGLKRLHRVLLKDKGPKAKASKAKARSETAKVLKVLIKALSDSDADTRRNSHEAIGAITAIYFTFNASAAPEMRAKQIAEIKSRLAGLKHVHGRAHRH